MSGEEGFLARWSRRKRGAATEEPLAEPEAAAPPPEAVAPSPEAATSVPPPAVERAAAPAPAACPLPGVPEFDLASLPRIEELTVSSDLGPFLRPGVPATLRAAALRRMWSLDPAIRDYIGPVEYQWDFNTPGGLPTGFASELGGEVKKLLAQAIGLLDEDEAETPREDEAAEQPEVVVAIEAEDPPPTPLPESPLRLEAPPVPVPQVVPDLLPEEEKPLPRRRHGGALPA